MTRMQIIAKAAINGLCFLAVGVLLHSHRFIWVAAPPYRSWVFVLIAAVTGAGIVWLLSAGLNNFRLAFKLAGEEQANAARLEKRSFLIAMRFTSVSVGLFLLARFPEVFTQVVQLAVGLIGSGGDFFTSVFEGEFLSALDMTIVGVIKLFYPVGLCVWIVYLLTGAERIVRSQARLAETWLEKNKKVRSGL